MTFCMCVVHLFSNLTSQNLCYITELLIVILFILQWLYALQLDHGENMCMGVEIFQASPTTSHSRVMSPSDLCIDIKFSQPAMQS